jgi:hypothetical protein
MFIPIPRLLQLSTEATDGPFARNNLVVPIGSERATGEKGSENTYMPAPNRPRFYSRVGVRWNRQALDRIFVRI